MLYLYLCFAVASPFLVVGLLWLCGAGPEKPVQQGEHAP